MQPAKLKANISAFFCFNRCFYVLIAFTLFYLLLHLPNLGTNELNPDAVNWHKRSEQFVLAFKTRDFAKTNQHYHPGVTLMWIIGPSVELVKQVTDIGTLYTSESYLSFHLTAKLALLLVNLVISLLLVYFLGKIIGFWKSIAVVTLMNLEPFFLGNSRVLHMDVLFSSLVALGLTLAFYAVMAKKSRFYVLAGFIASVTILTRSVGIGLIAYSLSFFSYIAVALKNKKILQNALIFFVSVLVICFAMFPALWVKPIKTVDKIFSRSYQVGVEFGHNQLFFNQYTENPGLAFYPVAILLKTSPFLLTGLLLLVVFSLKVLKTTNIKSFVKQALLGQTASSYTLFIVVFYLGYFVLINISNKKIDRYLLPLFFLFSYASVWGYYYLFKFYNSVLLKIVAGVWFILTILYPSYKFAPYEFLYYSPIFQSSSAANNVISQKNFGMGMYHLKQYVDERYTCKSLQIDYPKTFVAVTHGTTYLCPTDKKINIGLSDTKAMKELHGNSNVTDFRFNSPSLYDVLILAIDEEMPKEVLEENATYTKDASVFVKDIELWRIYVREN